MSAQGRTPARRRAQLAKSELLLHLSMTAARWGSEVAGTDPRTTPFEEWPAGDPIRDIASRYNLEPCGLVRVLDRLADELENRATNAGYDEAWV